MTFEGRQTMLSSLDLNSNNGVFSGAHASQSSASKQSLGAGAGGSVRSSVAGGASSSRTSMIPRHSVAPPRAAEYGGLGSSMRAGSGTSGMPRSSMAASVGAGMYGHAGTDDQDRWAAGVGAHSVNSTPHHGQAPLGTRRGAGGEGTSRQSIAPPTAGRMSVAPTPNARKSMGRASLAPGRGGLMGAKGGAMHMTDPRPIREDKSYLARMEAEIQDFLVHTSFAFPPKYSGEFHMPSQALVMSVFRHLYHQCIDLRYVFVAEPKKEVEEVLQLLNDIKYPMIIDLSKTKLGAPGSIHNWPPICGMLHWMVCLESSLERVTTKYHGGPLERPVSAEDEDFCHYFPYLWHCYEQFWDSKDDYPEEQAKLERIFDDKSARARQDLARMRDEHMELEDKLAELLENDSPLDVELKEKSVLESDVKKFIEYRDAVLLTRIQQYSSVIDKLKADATMHSEQIQQRTQERDRLRREVEAQDVSADDFESMSREREQLGKQLTDILAKLHDRSSVNSHTEISLSNKQARVEDDLKELSDRCREIDLFPFTLQDGRQTYDFEMAAGNTTTMLPNGLDIRHDVRRKITEKCDRLARQYREVMGIKLKDQEAYDMLLEKVEELRETVDKMDMRLRSVREQTELANTASKEENRIQAELEAKNEVMLAQIDQAGRAAVDQAQARLQSARMQLNLARERDTTLRKELHDQYVLGLETILSLKSAVTEGLKTLQETAEQCTA